MTHAQSSRPPKVLAVASGGGHWVELRRMRAAWSGARIAYLTTMAEYRAEVEQDDRDGGDRAAFFSVPDANQTNRLRLAWLALCVAVVVLRVRPDVVISTGAAIGYLALRVGRLLGARTIWIDSIANAETLSLSGRLAGPYSDLWLTQWAHLATPDGPRYAGVVL